VLGPTLGPAVVDAVDEYIAANEFMVAFEAIEHGLSEKALTPTETATFQSLAARFEPLR
jgi:hypothetical protein